MAVSYVCKHMNFATIRVICFENKKSQTYENGHFLCLQTGRINYQCMTHMFGIYKNGCFICLQTWKHDQPVIHLFWKRKIANI